MMVANRRFKVGTKVRLLRATVAGDEAIVLERLEPKAVSVGQYESSFAGVGGDAHQVRYRVQNLRTGQELIERENVLEACAGTEFE